MLWQRKKESGFIDGATVTLKGIWGSIAWLTGLLVSLAVGFGMIDGSLRVPYVPFFVTSVAGSIVVVLALLGAILAVIDRIGK